MKVDGLGEPVLVRDWRGIFWDLDLKQSKLMSINPFGEALKKVFHSGVVGKYYDIRQRISNIWYNINRFTDFIPFCPRWDETAADGDF